MRWKSNFSSICGEGEDIGLLDVEALGDDFLFGGLGHAAAHQAEEVEQRLGQEAGSR